MCTFRRTKDFKISQSMLEITHRSKFWRSVVHPVGAHEQSKLLDLSFAPLHLTSRSPDKGKARVDSRPLPLRPRPQLVLLPKSLRARLTDEDAKLKRRAVE